MPLRRHRLAARRDRVLLRPRPARRHVRHRQDPLLPPFGEAPSGSAGATRLQLAVHLRRGVAGRQVGHRVRHPRSERSTPSATSRTTRAGRPRGDGPGLCVQGFFDGDAYIALSHEGADRGRIVRLPLATAGDHGTWDELRPGGAARAPRPRPRRRGRDGGRRPRGRTFAGAPLHARRGGSTGAGPAGPGHRRARLLDTAGSARRGWSHPRARRSRSCSRYETAPAGYLDELPAGSSRNSGPPARTPERRLVVRREVASAADGTPIPYTVVHRGDLDMSVPQPTLVYVYGGWNVALGAELPRRPQRDRRRGGGARAAERARRRRAAASAGGTRRAARRTTSATPTSTPSPRRSSRAASTRADAVAVAGISDGGLRACAAAAQRPDLFSACIALLPLADLLRFTQAPMTWTFTSEYGDPMDARRSRGARCDLAVRQPRTRAAATRRC